MASNIAKVTAASQNVPEKQQRLEWSSPRTTVVATTQDDDTTAVVVVGGDMITVPYSGFYSISFGYPTPILCESLAGRKRKRQQGRKNDDMKTTQGGGNHDHDDHAVVAYLEIQQTEAESRHESRTNNGEETADTSHETNHKGDADGSLPLKKARRLSLPWREEAEEQGNPQLLDPPSIHLGRVLWLAEQTRLKVIAKLQSGKQSTTWDNTKANLNGGSTIVVDKEEPPQWQVVLQSVPRQLKSNQVPKKSWVCTICRRAFHSAFSVSQHQEQAHYEQISQGSSDCTAATSSIWTAPLPIIYNDDYLGVVVKPQGMAVMGDFEGRTLQRSSLLLALMKPGHLQQPKTKFAWPTDAASTDNNNKDIDSKDASHDTSKEPRTDDKNIKEKWDNYLGKPRPCHRLDAPTGGLLVVAKTRLTERALKQSFEDRSCHKTYRALLYGKIAEDQGECSQPLSGKPSLTQYRVLHRSRSVTSPDGWLTTVELYPHTGRMHQLRKHMQLMGHAIWGDKRYGPKQSNKNNEGGWQSRLCLWAMAIRFPHPVTGKEISCRMEEPEWLQQVVQHEQEAWEKANPSETCS